MAFADEFNPEQVAHELTTAIYQRMVEGDYPEAETQAVANVVFDMARVACSLVISEPGIDTGNNNIVPYDMNMAMQAVRLFTEGIYHSTVKSRQMGLPEELQTPFLQNIAQDLFMQAKHIVISTLGQENTPEHQFPWEQQVAWINQTAESSLHYHILQYEKENGPIQDLEKIPPSESVVEQAEALLSTDESLMGEGLPAEIPAVLPPPAAATVAPKPADAVEAKYAAVALLLTTLPPTHHGTILRRFTPPERERIAFYAHPENIERHLDVHVVNQQLLQLKQLLKGGDAKPRSRFYQAMAELATRHPQTRLLEALQRERQTVRAYATGLYGKPTSGGETLPPAKLPPRVEEILCHYLTQTLEGEARR